MTDLSKFIEHTILRPDTTLADVRRLCEEAIQHQFAGVCIPPFFVRDARRILGDFNKVKLVTVVGFPMGYSAIAAKSEEIKRACDEDADDIDAVINIAAVKTGNWNVVEHDIDSVARATQMRGKTLKLILECGLLTKEEIERICAFAETTNIHWIKTGTGFHNKPATPEMVAHLRKILSPATKIKAAGGIKTAADARALLEAGADRLGTSASLEIIR